MKGQSEIQRKDDAHRAGAQDDVSAARKLVDDIRRLISEACQAVAVTVNAGFAMLHWHIGERINRDIEGRTCRIRQGDSRDTVERIGAPIRSRVRPEEPATHGAFRRLLFFHRDLRRLVAIEFTLDKFRPEHLGQMELGTCVGSTLGSSGCSAWRPASTSHVA